MNTCEHGSIVIVDDNPDNLQVLSSILRQGGFKVRPARSGEIALCSIAASAPDLVLLDICMPGIDGYETCQRLKADPLTCDIPIIFISALNESEDKLTAFRAGGVDYISKPFQTDEVLARAKVHIQLRQMQQRLESLVAERTGKWRDTCASLEESRTQYRRMLEQTIQAIALTIEKRDPYTAGHQLRVSQLAAAMAHKLGMPQERTEGLRLASMIHDVGKIYLPAEILSRPGRLTAPEFSMVKTHSEVGAEILRGVEFPWPVADMLLQHHERQDGSGYPQGLRGNEILLEARILAVADVVEAMASHRPYRPALGIQVALDEIRRGAGRIYDADPAAACLELFETDGYRLPPSMVV